MDCQLMSACKKRGDTCQTYCYPYVLLHGVEGDTGLYGMMNVPTKYKKCRLSNLPIGEQNPKIATVINRYLNDIPRYIQEENRGLFLYSVPTTTNRFGVGTGKTTTAITILNEYLFYRVKQHLKREREITYLPSFFVKASEFQNVYNAQFRGDVARQKESSEAFYQLKRKMKHSELVVIDDIAIRDMTDALKNELFEIIDYRVTEELTTIYTSNFALEQIIEMLGERIVSRIDASTYALALTGDDMRKKKGW